LRDGEINLKVNKAPRVECSGVDPKYVRHLEEKLREASEELGKLYLVVESLKKIHQDPKSTKSASSFIVTSSTWARSKGRAR
jgi:hypothetical protein